MTSLSGEDDNLAELVEHFGSSLFLVFSHFFFEVEFKKDKEFFEEFVKEPGPDIIRGLRVGS
jgi:D-mannonate dehydratase